MIKTIDPAEETAGRAPIQLDLTSVEALDTAVAHVVRLRIQRTQVVAEKDAEVALIEKRFAARIASVEERIAAEEQRIREYCDSHRAELFPVNKSRETATAVFGFELTPPRVETSSRKVTWKDVVARLLKLTWGRAYVRTPEPKPDKEALLADREKLTPEQLTAAGITFAQDEQFFIRPKPETAQE
jgi:phage host-nuclease inhibitor protein Gam